jgi:hypothetical protein
MELSSNPALGDEVPGGVAAQGSTAQMMWDANTGRSQVLSMPPLAPASTALECGGIDFRLDGRTVTASFRADSRNELLGAMQVVGAPGRIRTRDPLLRSHFRAVAGRRLVSPNVPSSCMNRLALSPYVARYFSPVAPRLAPRNLVNIANVRIHENSVEYDRLLSLGPGA